MNYLRGRFALTQWVIFLVLNLTYILVYFHRIAPAVMSSDLMSAFRISGTALGSLAAIYFYVYAAMQIPAGLLADTLGIRKTIVMGNIAAGVGSVLFALATSLWLASIGRFFVGLGVSVIFVGIMKSNSVWFTEERYGAMTGLTVFLGNIGSLLATSPLALLLVYISWRSVFFGIGAVTILLGWIAWFVVRNRPEEYGYAPLTQQPAAGEINRSELFKQFLAVVKNRQIWPGILVNFFAPGGLYAFMGLWAIPWMRDTYALSRQDASFYVSILVVGFALGAVFWGWVSDALKNRKGVLIISLILYALCWLAMIFVSSWLGGVGLILSLVMGFSGSGFILCMSNAKEISHPYFAGIAVATVNIGSFLGVAVIQPLFGKVLDYFWSGALNSDVRVYHADDYRIAFAVMLLFAVIALISAFFVPETRCRSTYKQ